MLYNNQNYWVFRLFPSSIILETRKNDVSETIHPSIHPQMRGKTPTQLCRLETADLNHWKTPVRFTQLLVFNHLSPG
jgi:hypothetical protein